MQPFFYPVLSMDKLTLQEIYDSAEFRLMSLDQAITMFYTAAIDLYENDGWEVSDLSNALYIMLESEYYEAMEGVKSAITVIKFIENGNS